MSIEDHAGDVVSKARAAMGLSGDAAAEAAGISPAEFATLESCGEGRADWGRLGGVGAESELGRVETIDYLKQNPRGGDQRASLW